MVECLARLACVLPRQCAAGAAARIVGRVAASHWLCCWWCIWVRELDAGRALGANHGGAAVVARHVVVSVVAMPIELVEVCTDANNLETCATCVTLLGKRVDAGKAQAASAEHVVAGAKLCHCAGTESL